MKECNLCKDTSCIDTPDGRVILDFNGKDIQTRAESPIFIEGCIVRQRHEKKDLLKHLHQSFKRQNLPKI